MRGWLRGTLSAQKHPHSRDGLARIGPGLECGYGRSSRKELRCLTNVRTLFAAPSFVTSIKESYLKLKFNIPRIPPALKASQAMRQLRLSEKRQAN